MEDKGREEGVDGAGKRLDKSRGREDGKRGGVTDRGEGGRVGGK